MVSNKSYEFYSPHQNILLFIHVPLEQANGSKHRRMGEFHGSSTLNCVVGKRIKLPRKDQ